MDWNERSQKTKINNPLRSLYDWVLSWADSPYGGLALFLLAFAESSFFPVPPDVLLIALCMGAPRRWWRFALICSVGSVLGGMFGYFIGFKLYDIIGEHILNFVGKLSRQDPIFLRDTAKHYFDTYGVWAVGIAGFTPVPYKVFTITAGFFKMSFVLFVIASALSRSARFFIVGGLIGLLFEKYGLKIKAFIDRYFNLLAIIFVVLLIGGFVVLKYLK